MPDADPHDQALAAVLPPALRELIRGHALTLGRPVWGQRAGRHRAARAGLGQLFRAHRPYVPGDDPRLLDWRAMARRDRPVLRQTEGEDELALVLLADVSGGMSYGEGDSNKMRASAGLLAALALLAIRQGDRVGLASGGVGALLRPAGGTPRLHAIAGALARAIEGPPAGTCPWPELVAAAAPRLPRRSLVIAASDLLDPCGGDAAAEAALWRSFAGLRARGHDVVLLQVLHRDELAPPWAGGELLRVLDPRGSAPPLEGRAATLLRGYQERLQAHLDGIDAAAEAAGIHVARVISDEPLAAAFLDLLARLAGAPAPAATAISP